MARGETLPALAKRTGVREDNLRAIEQGRFADLPTGLYGRAAIRSFASAFKFDPAEALAACESQLTPMAEPISALGRLRGVRQPATPPIRETANPASRWKAPGQPTAGSVFPSSRPLAAAALDACVVAALLVVVVGCAITSMTIPVARLGHSAPAFGLMGLLLGAAYFVWFGGLAGRTLGEQVFWVEPGNPGHASLTLRAIGERALLAATEDVRCLQALGAWAGKTARQRFSVRSAPHPEPLP